MKVTIERAKLLKTLVHVQSVVERRNTIPILSNVLLRADGDRLVMTTTDLDIQIVDSAEATVKVGGTTTVQAQTLLDIVRKLQEGSLVELSIEDGRVRIAAGRSRFQLPCLPADDFPVVPRGEMEHSFTVSTSVLQEVIQRTRFAMSTEETRYYLNGMYLHVNDDGLQAAATDGHRLARTRVETGDAAIKGMPGVIIPRKTIGELAKIMAEYDGDVEISVSRNKIAFDVGDIQLTSKTIDGTFPDYERVIPQGNAVIVTADAKTLSGAIERVSVIASEKTRSVRVKVEDGIATLSVTSPENGTAVDEIPCVNKGFIDIGFNSRYLIEILDHVSAENVEIHFGDSAAPVLLIDSKRPGDATVIMPMRV